jgi:hypothetical protein
MTLINFFVPAFRCIDLHKFTDLFASHHQGQIVFFSLKFAPAGQQTRGRIFSHVRPFCERAVSNLDIFIELSRSLTTHS